MAAVLRWFLAVAALAAPALPPAARAQATDARNRALIILDASKSMNEDAGNGGTRLDAAKQAVHELLDRLPPGARVGLRVYGSKVSQASRAEGCRDTALAIPVGPLDKGAMRSAVDGLNGTGRTPIGRSLLAAPGDLGTAPGRRTVVLISDGGDNCAPPDPCKAARRVAQQGLQMSISVVGLQVTPRVRRQLRCIARAGGGSYVDVQDAGKLGDELAAALARAFRSYEPTGTKITGGPTPQRALALGTGLFLDSIATEQTRYYAVDVPRGKRLVTSATAVPPRGMQGSGNFNVELTDAAGDNVDLDASGVSAADGPSGSTVPLSVRTEGLVGGTLPAGRYVLKVAVQNRGGTLDPVPIPVEIAIQLLGPGEDPGVARVPGKLATPTPTPKDKPAGEDASGDEGGVSWPVYAGVGLGGIAMGLAAAAVLGRRRRL